MEQDQRRALALNVIGDLGVTAAQTVHAGIVNAPRFSRVSPKTIQ